MSAALVIPRPAADEHDPYYGRYIDLVEGELVPSLERGLSQWLPRVRDLDEAGARHRYAPGKWSVKEVLGHIIDGERVFAYRALRFARKDTTPLPGFEENEWVPAGRFDRRPLPDLVAEYEVVRAATLAMFGSFDEDDLLQRGKANDAIVSVRALAHIIAGHELHHVGLLKERYGLA